jgi:predicted ribosomally synthesized peptide with SipW-like signal peptide
MEINRKILAGVFFIGLLAFGLGWGTYSYFSDTETSTGNVFTAGTIDIDVDGDNPWTSTYSLDDMKPSQTGWIEFVINNVGGNPVDVWKHIHVTGCDHGEETEPEIEECGGTDVRCWLPPYIIYDLWTSMRGYVVHPDQQIRVDNVDCMWIYLGRIPAGESMTVKQSYHLASWEDAPVEAVTNWAQGDTMTFDIELYAEQVSGVGPIGAEDTVELVKKDPLTWEVIGTTGTLTFNTAGTTFDYTFEADGLASSTDYSLIYYADPWPGDGTDHSTGALIAKFTSDAAGEIASTSGSIDLGTDLPNSKDKNFGVGAKIWLVPSTDYSTTTVGSQGYMTAWNPSNYLFEMHLINYDDTDA